VTLKHKVAELVEVRELNLKKYLSRYFFKFSDSEQNKVKDLKNG